MPEASVKLVREMLEVLQDGTERGKPVAVSGARLSINAPEIAAQPRRLEVAPTSLDSLNWNKLIVGLDRFDPKKKLAAVSGGGGGGDQMMQTSSNANPHAAQQARAQDKLVGRILQARTARPRSLYSNASL